MRLRKFDIWSLIANVETDPVEFVVSFTRSERTIRFCSRSSAILLEDDDGNEVVVNAGLLTDLSGQISVSLDPRRGGNPLPTMPSLAFAREAVADLLGGGTIPFHMGTFEIELSLASTFISWDDRVVILAGARADPSSIIHGVDGDIQFELLDTLSIGIVQIPQQAIDTSKLPAAWNQTFILDATNGVPYPTAMGAIHRAPPIRVYDDGGDAAADDKQPVRRYILAGHELTGTNATLHRTNITVRQLQSGIPDMSNLSKPIQLGETTDGKKFSWVQTDSGEEDPTATDPLTGKNHPVEVYAISYEATDGINATLGGVIRRILQNWSDIEIDGEVEASLSDVIDAFGSLLVSFLIDGEGFDRATVAELLDQRIRGQFPVAVARFGGRLLVVPTLNLMNPPGPGYQEPVVRLRLGSECFLQDVIKETGDIWNQFEVRYKRRGDDGLWDAAPLLASPDNDFECSRSAAVYGLRIAQTMGLEDVADAGTAGVVLDHQRNLFLEPWYEARIICNLGMTPMLPGQKVRLWHVEEPRIAESCPRHRWTLRYDESEQWRDAIVVSVDYSREAVVLGVIF